MSRSIKRAPSDKTTILIAEDSPTQAEHLRWLLEQNGFGVLVARDGEEAIAIAKQEHPAIIVSDVVMPKVNGYDLCRMVKSDPDLSDIGFLVVTTLSSSNDVFNGLVAGADDFLVKPYQEDQLIQRIQHLLTSKKSDGQQDRRAPLNVDLAGTHFTINSTRQQVTNFLVSTYEEAMALNKQLIAQQEDLRRSNEMVNALYCLAGGFNRCRTEADVAASAVSGALRIPSVRAAWLFLRDGDHFWLAGQAGCANIQEPASSKEACQCQRLVEEGARRARSTSRNAPAFRARTEIATTDTCPSRSLSGERRSASST